MKCRAGTWANDIVITVCGVRWRLEMSGETLCKVYGCLTTMLTLKLLQNSMESKLKLNKKYLQDVFFAG